MSTARFYKLPANVAAHPELNASDKILYAIIADHVGDNGKCWTGIRKLAAEAGVNRGTVIESIRRLEAYGFLKVERRRNGQTNHYRLTSQDVAAEPAGRLNRSEDPAATGGKFQLARESNRSESPTPGSRELQPEAVGKSDHNQIDQLNQTHMSSADKPSGRKADPIWDTLCELFGLKPQTKGEQSRVGKLVRDLKLKEATSETIRLKHAAYRHEHPDWMLTPEALLKWWDTLGNTPDPGGSSARAIHQAMQEDF